MAPLRRRPESKDCVLERRSIITLTAATRTHGRNDSEIVAVNNQSFRKSSGSLAMFTAMRRASSYVSSLAAV